MKIKYLPQALAIVGLAVLGFFLGRLTAPATILNQPTVEPTATQPTDLINSAPPPIVVPERTLVVETPVDEAAASGPFEVAGRALGGATVRADLKDGDGGVRWSGAATLAGKDFQRFSLTAEPAAPLEPGAYLLTVMREADGAKTETITRDVAVGVANALKIKLYFQQMSVGGEDCAAVQPVERLVSVKEAVYRTALTELLKGPTADEKADGFTTALPAGVTLKSVAADAAGTVTADFSKVLDKNVAGSCRVTAIRAQIEKTLQQFPEARSVIIAVDGRTEDILQP